MHAACIQLRSGTDVAANLDVTETFIRQAAANGAQLVATPEMTHILQRGSKALFEAITEEHLDPGVKRFSEIAKALKIDLLIGSLAIKTGPNRAANRSYLFGPDGVIKARYDKIHLFDVRVSETETWTESRIYDAGSRAVMAEAGEAKLGFSICYDLRFPHLYRRYAQARAHIMSVPAAFTRPTGEAHWEPLLRARAIETGSFVLAPAQGGTHEDGRSTWGRSLILGPWGEILAAKTDDTPGIISAEIDLTQVRDARQKIPSWSHEPNFSL